MYICVNDFPDSFEDKCRSLCDGTSIELHCVAPLSDLLWTEDEFFEGFYDSEEADDDDVEIDDADDNGENDIDNEFKEVKEEDGEDDQ